MARASTLSLRLRRAFEREHPKAQLDDALAAYFAGMLEDDEDFDEDNIVEEWSSYLSTLLESEGTSKEVCLSVLKRLKAWGEMCSRTNSPQLSREGSTNTQALPVSAGCDAPRVPSDGDEPVAEEVQVQGLSEWLEKLCLSHYAEPAHKWCSSMGAATVDEIEENWEEFSGALDLKFFERRRLQRCAGVDCDAVTPQGRERGGEDEERDDTIDELYSRYPASSEAPDSFERQEAEGDEEGEGAPFFMSASSSNRRRELKTFGPADDPYTILEELGQGMTATVYACKRGDQIYAVKAIGLSRLQMQRNKEKALEQLRRESAILFALRHPHVVSLYDVHETFERRFLVMEFVEGGELIDEISENGPLAEYEARYVFLQVVLGLRYIHSKGVVHRDLKLENVLVDRNLSQPGLLQVKISDFGHSKLVDDGYSRTFSQVGTPNYWAPEVANASAGGYDERIDLWSLGVVLFVLVSGTLPFPSRSRCDLQKLSFPEEPKLSHLARHLIWSLIQVRPEDRLSLDDCLRHPWVMDSSGLVQQVVRLCEAHSRIQRGERERWAVLPRDPKNVQKLRKSLQELTLFYKYPISLRARREVALCFREADDLASVDAAWQDLQSMLNREFRGDLETYEVALDETALLCEQGGGRQSLGFSEERLEQQDAELAALAAAFPRCVEAARGSCAPTPRHLEVSLSSGLHSLWLRLELPLAYPARNRPPELTHLLAHQSPDTPASISVHESLKSQVGDFLRDSVADAQPGEGLSMLVCWLQEHLMYRIGLLNQPTLQPEAQVADEPDPGPANDASDSSTPVLPCTTSSGEEFARMCMIAHHHDEKLDATGLASDRLRASLRRLPFFTHLKNKFDKITGFLSFGKPALLLAEGPQQELYKLESEVKKFPKWWDVSVEMFDRQKAVENTSTWRAFSGFVKIKTEELDVVLSGLSPEHCKIYEDALVGSTLDRKKRLERARKGSKKS